MNIYSRFKGGSINHVTPKSRQTGATPAAGHGVFDCFYTCCFLCVFFTVLCDIRNMSVRFFDIRQRHIEFMVPYTSYTIYNYMCLLSFSYDYTDNCLTGCLAYLIALVPLATVALMIGCNGRNHHCLLTALRSSPLIEFNMFLLSFYVYILSSLYFCLVASGHLFLLSFESLLIIFLIHGK